MAAARPLPNLHNLQTLPPAYSAGVGVTEFMQRQALVESHASNCLAPRRPETVSLDKRSRHNHEYDATGIQLAVTAQESQPRLVELPRNMAQSAESATLSNGTIEKRLHLRMGVK